MAMVVNHNIPALMTYNTVNRTSSALEKSIQKLSTGLRINSAADDAAGLAISEKMRAQINGLDRAVANAQDGISMIQTAEGALNETHAILQRMRELSVQAANDTLTQQDRGYIQLEIDQLREEITRIGNTTQFNKKKLLNGDAAVLWSSDNLETKALIRGGLRSIDQFGQKVVTEGNYKIKIKADAGQGEVQKSDIFKIKHENVIMNKSVDSTKGVKDVAINKLPAGSYEVAVGSAPASPTLTGQYNVAKSVSTNTTGQIDTTGMTGSVSAAGLGTYTLKIGDTVLASVKATDEDETKGDLLKRLVDTAKANASTLPKGILMNIDDSDPDKPVITVSRGDGEDVGDFAVDFVGEGASATAALTASDIGGSQTTSAIANVGDIFTLTASTSLIGNASVLFEVTDVNATAGTVTLKANATILKEDGTTATTSVDGIVVDITGGDVDSSLLGTGALNIKLGADVFDPATGKLNMAAVEKGTRFVYNLTVDPTQDPLGAATEDVYVEVSGTQNPNWPQNWLDQDSGVTRSAVTYGLDADKVKGKEVHLKNWYLNEKTGEAWEGEVILSTTDDFTKANLSTPGDTLATFDAAYVGQVARGDVKLRDLDKFWTSEGVFMLTDPQTITITQGDGKQTSVTLYANDTLDDVARKFREAVGVGLGQAQYINGDSSDLATFVSGAGTGQEAVAGTFVIRSVVPGASGTLRFSGDESLINAFSLNVIQDAKESSYTVDIMDAHTGTSIVSKERVTGNQLIGLVHENVDVMFDAMAGLTATWSAAEGKYVYSANDYETTLHLADNTTVFQIGANEGEDMGIHIGDMRATALGLDSVLVTDRVSAARSITIIDNAIDKVSTQRAKLGAYQNRLEHTINNLNTAGENLTAAESRIRDTDMAKEMMNFTKLQIMLQAGTSMLAQANQLPQNVLALIR